MNERSEAKPKEDIPVSGAKPRPEGPVRERGWRPTVAGGQIQEPVMEAARPRVIEAADNATANVRDLDGGRE